MYMISVVVCSRSQTISNNLFKNIRETIGCNYELIIIDNSKNKYSIFDAYNMGIDKSKGEFLCFIHDDIFIHTNCWGKVLLNIFQEDNNIGLIGVAGAKLKTKIPSAWWDCPEDFKAINIIQHFKHKEKEIWNFGFENKQKIEVVAIDGVFMAMRKKMGIHFDSKMINFHNYDLNISFECFKMGHKIIVTNEILIEHFSKGTINDSWIQSTYAIHRLYKNILPINITTSHVTTEMEFNNAKTFITECLKFKNYSVATKVWLNIFIRIPISKYHIQFWKRILKEKLC